MSEPPVRPGRHLGEPAARAPWDVLTDPRPTEYSEPAGGAADAGPAQPTPAGPASRLWSEVFDRLPAGGQRIAVDLGRHWWLPVAAALAVLALTIGIAVRARPVAAQALPTSSGSSVGVLGTSATADSSGPSPGGSPSAAASRSLGASPGGSTAGSGVAGDAPPVAAAPAGPVAATVVVVDVAGRVRRPGVVRLPPGSRVVDAIRAAGGALPRTNLNPLDLAEPLLDGEQVRVGLPGAPVASPTSGSVPTPAGGDPGSTADSGPAISTGPGPPVAPVDLNTAGVTELDQLPRIGPVLAARIVAWRTAHGPFGSVDDLEGVPGIGPATMAMLRDLVTAGP